MTRLLSLRTGACQLKCAVQRSAQSLSASSGNATVGKLTSSSFHYRPNAVSHGRMHRQSYRLHSSSHSNNHGMTTTHRERGITAIQMNLELNKLSNENTAPNLSALTSWILQKVKIPKGE
jgi:hypothetical protein